MLISTSVHSMLFKAIAAQRSFLLKVLVYSDGNSTRITKVNLDKNKSSSISATCGITLPPLAHTSSPCRTMHIGGQAQFFPSSMCAALATTMPW